MMAIPSVTDESATSDKLTAAQEMAAGGIANSVGNGMDTNSISNGMDMFFSFVEDVSAGFDLFDVDGDDHITRDEIGDVMRSLGEEPSEEDLNAMMRVLDVDGNGTVEYIEFLNMVTDQSKLAEKDQSVLFAAVQNAAREARSERKRKPVHED